MRISVAGLDARYELSRQRIYQNLAVVFPDKTITGIFGPNGVGKSTLLRLLARLDMGVLSNARAAVAWEKANGYISYAPQGYSASLMPWMSIDENILLPLRTAQGEQQTNLTLRCTALKQRFGLAYASKYPTGLSGGQQQTVVLLRSLIRHPDFLILDEPFSALDIYAGAQFRANFVEYLRTEQISGAFVTHDLRECIRFSDRIIFLDRDSNGLAIVKHVEEFKVSHRTDSHSEDYTEKLHDELTELLEQKGKISA